MTYLHKPKRTKKSPRRLLVAKLDNLFSLYIRLKTKILHGAMCPFCLKAPIQHCFHFITRACYSIRWDEMNAVGSCAGCNYLNEFKPTRFEDWYIKRYGQEAWNNLKVKSYIIPKFDNSELEAMALDLKGKIEGLSR